MRVSNVDKFLEDSFIPSHVITKRIENEDGEVFYKQIMPLSAIMRLKLSDDKKQHAIKYISDKGIQVIGYSDKMNFESEDYLHTRTYRGRSPESISKEETQKLLELYRKTKDINIRNKIVVGNMRLVNFAIVNLNNEYHSAIYDLEQAGCIGLIKAVENYDPSKGAFSTLAMSYIYGYIRIELYELKGLKKSEYAFYIACKEVEKEYGEKIANNPALAEIVVDRLIESGFRIPEHKKENIRRVLLMNPISLDSVLENEEEIYELGYEPEDSAINSVYDKELKLHVSKELSKLQELKAEIIKMRYGLSDAEPKTLSEIGKEVDMTGTWVNGYIKRTLNHLSAKEKVKSLELYLHREI